MKFIDFIVLAIFLFLIVSKIWVFSNVEDKLGLPLDLYTLHIVGWIILLAAIATIRFKKRIAKIFVLLMVILALAENLWRFEINDIGLGYLLFRIIGYLFLGSILWLWAKSKTINANDKSRIL